MYPNEAHTRKNENTKHSATKQDKAKDPPGVSMPPETEMMPAQLG